MSIVSLNCPVCKNYKFDTFKDVFDDRYAEPNPYKLAKCTKCNHISTFPRLKEQDLGELYKKHYPRKHINPEKIFKKANKDFSSLSSFLYWFKGINNQGHFYAKKGEIVLDIGCGDCSSLIEINNLGAKGFGIEADTNVKSIAKSLNLDVHFGSIEDKPFLGKKFDLIVMNQVIEHIPEPDKCIKIIKGRLSKNGRIIFVFPNRNSLWQRITGVRWINWHIPYHLHHFDKKSFQNMLENCGLKVTNTKTITPNVWTILQIRHLFYNHKRGVPNFLWEEKKDKRDKNHKQMKIKLKLILIKKCLSIILFICIGFLNRLIDFLNVGDSLMLEVKTKK